MDIQSSFYRQNRTWCGDYQEVDIIPRTKNGELAAKGKRSKKKKVSAPKQQNLNDKNAKRHLIQLINGNFDEGDVHVSATYSPEFLPNNEQEANKMVENYLRRIRAKRKREGLPPLKYIVVTEYKKDENGEYATRLHHHIIMNAGLSRDDLEDLWAKGRGKKKKPIGLINTRKLQKSKSENGFEALANYIIKDPKGKKRWSSSRNLKRPERRKNDYLFRHRKIEQLCLSNDDGYDYFAKKYPKFHIIEVKKQYFEMTGWHVYLKMWRKEKVNSE